jgi:Zn-dependent protease with chaperone function
MVAFAVCSMTIRRILGKEETDFWKVMESCGPARLLAPADPEILLPGLPLAVFLIAPISLILILSAISPWLAILGGLWLLVVCPPIIAAQCLRNRTTMLWKPVLLIFMSRWCSVNFSVLCAFLLLSLANATVHRLFGAGRPIPTEKQTEATGVATADETIALLRVRTDDPIAVNRAILSVAIDQAVQAVADQHPNKAEYAAVLRRFYELFLRIGLGMFIVTGIGYMVFCWKRLFKVPRDWQELLGSERSIPISVPTGSHDEHPQRTIGIAAFVLYVAGSVTNVASALIGLDALVFIFTRRTVIIPWAETLYAWVPAVIPCSNENVGSYPQSAFPVSTKIAIFFFAIPFFIFVSSRLLHLITFLSRKTMHFVKSQNVSVPPDVVQWALRLCDEKVLARPRFRIVSSVGVLVRIRVPGFFLRPVIEITRDTIQQLSPTELKAALAHEIGHLNQHGKVLSLVRILSGFGLFPNSILALVFDFVQWELDADTFALDTTKDPDALINAIIKTGISHLPVRTLKGSRAILGKLTHSPRVSQFLRGPIVFLRFFFSSEILGYTHLHPLYRIELIRAQRGWRQTQS